MSSINLGLAVRSMQKARLRSLLTMLGVTIATTAVVLSVNVLTGMESQVQKRIDSLGGGVLSVRSGRVVVRDENRNVVQQNLNELVASPTLTKADLESINTLDNIEATAPLASVSSSIKTRDSSELIEGQIVATSSNVDTLLNQNFRYGNMFDEDKRTKAAVLGYEIAEEMFGDTSPVGRAFKIGKIDYIVRGVFERFPVEPFTLLDNNYNRTIFIPYTSVGNFSEPDPLIQEILVKTSADNADELAVQIEETLTENHNDIENFSVLGLEDLQNVGRDLFSNGRTVVIILAATSLIVGGVGIMNTLLVSVSERTREIGIRKAIGATNSQILMQFLTEAVVLSSLGGVFGIVLAEIFSLAIRSTTNIVPSFNINVMAFAIVVSMLLGVVFGAGPAWKAASKKPINALRS